MKHRIRHAAAYLLSALLGLPALLLSGAPSPAWAAEGQGSSGHESRSYSDEAGVPKGIIGVSLHIAAERVGDPAVLYVGHVHPQSPAQQVGLSHGDVISAIDGASVNGKSHEQIVMMVRGKVGTSVKLAVKGEKGEREVTITRVAAETLSKGPMGAHGNPDR
jgi:S1-C subfamily serine protease